MALHKNPDPPGRHPLVPAAPAGPDRLVARFCSGDALRSRRVSGVVLSGTVDVPAAPPRLVADWTREIAMRLRLEPGDVEPLSLPRARARWPEYRQCLRAASDWMRTLGLHDVLATGEIALMACRGARYHHDGTQYGGSAFCNLFLSEDRGLDVHFPAAGRRIPLVRGTVLVFDTGQPHAVVPRGKDRFDGADFAADADRTQVFLTWELPIEDPRVACALGIVFDLDPPAGIAGADDEERVCLDGAPVRVCPASGRFLRGEDQAVT